MSTFRTRFLLLLVLSLCVCSPGESSTNQPPTACFTVAPAHGTVDTLFTVDAGCAADDRTESAKLSVRWDWEGDGVWDTPFTLVKTASHQYAREGVKAIKVEVRDEEGLTAIMAQGVIVLPGIGSLAH